MLGTGFMLLLLIWVIGNFARDPSEFLNVLLIGLTNGAVYGLIALGYTLVYGILQLINFAHGDVFALCGLFASTLILMVFDLSAEDAAIVIVGGLAATLLIGMTFGSVLNATIEFLAYRRMRKAPRLAALITAVGMSFIVQNVGLAIYGVGFRSATDPRARSTRPARAARRRGRRPAACPHPR